MIGRPGLDFPKAIHRAHCTCKVINILTDFIPLATPLHKNSKKSSTLSRERERERVKYASERARFMDHRYVSDFRSPVKQVNYVFPGEGNAKSIDFRISHFVSLKE